MSSEEDIYCTKCNNKTEQTLMLSCEHNLCLSCAAKSLNEQHIKDFNSVQYLKCDQCNSLTELDPETTKQILSEGGYNQENDFNQNNMNNNNENYIIDNIDSNYFLDFEDGNNGMNKHPNNKQNIQSIKEKQSSQTKTNHSNKRGDNNISASEINIINDLMSNHKNLCKEHGEPLTYLCLDCMSNCVCPECVVHGIHRNHEVLNIKKAYPLIYNKMQDLSKYVNDQIKELGLVNETISKKKIFMNTLIDRCKNEVHNTFEQIRIRLDNKEKEIINKTTNYFNKNIYELNNYNNIIQNKLSTLSNLIDQINNTVIKKDELNTINYFCENKNKILSQAELNELNTLPDLDTFTNIKIEPDKLTLNKILEGMNNFHFNVNNTKGMDMNNRGLVNNNNLSKMKSQSNFNNNNQFNTMNNINAMKNNMNNNMNANMTMNNNNMNRNQFINNNQRLQNNNYMNQRPKSSKGNNQNRQMNNMMKLNNNFQQPSKNINQNMIRNNMYGNNNIPNNIMGNNCY